MQIKFVCILITAVLAGYTQALPVEGVADAIGGAGISGIGQIVGNAPAAVLKTAHTIDHSPGVIGSVDQAVFGQ